MQIVIDIPEEKFSIIKNKMYCGIYDPDLYKAIANGTPQKSGKWRYVAEDKYSCSKCGTTTRVDESGIDEKPMYKFCPYCGADMRGEK